MSDGIQEKGIQEKGIQKKGIQENRILKDRIRNMTLDAVSNEYSYVHDFFTSMSIEYPERKRNKTMGSIFDTMDEYDLEQKGVDKSILLDLFLEYLENMQQHQKGNEFKVSSITILGGHNKNFINENINLTLHCGDVLSIVGATGAGKSRFLADIEWLAQKDTPTGRQILINGEVPPSEWRFSIEHKLVAQLSQNMNFVMDVSVIDFIRMHAESRMITQNLEDKIKMILKEANRLAGEAIYEDTPVTSLSGGQSRALMIADTAFLSSSPIVLIDEIENAGIDRKTAVNLLIKREKIIVMATHDPVLALYADRRLVIQNGGMYRLLTTTQGEKTKLEELEKLNGQLMAYREKLRMGEILA